jgi:hypothetical protein
MEYMSAKNLKRWYPLKPLQVQLDLVHDDVRFKVVPAGRRSGKTERAKRYIVKQALKNPDESYFIAAPTLPQVKKIYWNDIKALTPQGAISRTSETEMFAYVLASTRILSTEI